MSTSLTCEMEAEEWFSPAAAKAGFCQAFPWVVPSLGILPASTYSWIAYTTLCEFSEPAVEQSFALSEEMQEKVARSEAELCPGARRRPWQSRSLRSLPVSSFMYLEYLWFRCQLPYHIILVQSNFPCLRVTLNWRGECCLDSTSPRTTRHLESKQLAFLNNFISYMCQSNFITPAKHAPLLVTHRKAFLLLSKQPVDAMSVEGKSPTGYSAFYL